MNFQLLVVFLISLKLVSGNGKIINGCCFVTKKTNKQFILTLS